MPVAAGAGGKIETAGSIRVIGKVDGAMGCGANGEADGPPAGFTPAAKEKGEPAGATEGEAGGAGLITAKGEEVAGVVCAVAGAKGEAEAATGCGAGLGSGRKSAGGAATAKGDDAAGFVIEARVAGGAATGAKGEVATPLPRAKGFPSGPLPWVDAGANGEADGSAGGACMLAKGF